MSSATDTTSTATKVFEIQDFSCVTEWERFVAEIERTLQAWHLTLNCNHGDDDAASQNELYVMLIKNALAINAKRNGVRSTGVDTNDNDDYCDNESQKDCYYLSQVINYINEEYELVFYYHMTLPSNAVASSSTPSSSALSHILSLSKLLYPLTVRPTHQQPQVQTTALFDHTTRHVHYLAKYFNIYSFLVLRPYKDQLDTRLASSKVMHLLSTLTLAMQNVGPMSYLKLAYFVPFGDHVYIGRCPTITTTTGASSLSSTFLPSSSSVMRFHVGSIDYNGSQKIPDNLYYLDGICDYFASSTATMHKRHNKTHTPLTVMPTPTANMYISVSKSFISESNNWMYDKVKAKYNAFIYKTNAYKDASPVTATTGSTGSSSKSNLYRGYVSNYAFDDSHTLRLAFI